MQDVHHDSETSQFVNGIVARNRDRIAAAIGRFRGDEDISDCAFALHISPGSKPGASRVAIEVFRRRDAREYLDDDKLSAIVEAIQKPAPAPFHYVVVLTPDEAAVALVDVDAVPSMRTSS